MIKLFRDIWKIILECMSVFSKDAITGRLSFSKTDSLAFFSIPLLIIIYIIYVDFTLSSDLSKAIIAILSIFVALAFQVVYIATDKFASRVNDRAREKGAGHGLEFYEDERNYLKRLGNFTRQFVRQLVLLLLLSLFIILCSTIGLCIKNHIVEVCLSGLILSLFYIWLLLLLKVMVSIYKLQMDDIEQYYRIIR